VQKDNSPSLQSQQFLKTEEARDMASFFLDYKDRKPDEPFVKPLYTTSYKSLLYFPKTYVDDSAPKSIVKWPLILFLHGAGERGDDFTNMRIKGLPAVLDREMNFPFIVVSPQCDYYDYWDSKKLLKLIEDIKKQVKIDEDRIYGTGFSMGGFGIWRMACDYPNLFAAIIPICAGGDINKAHLIKDLPTWAFHGRGDTIVPITNAFKMLNALKTAGSKEIKFTEYPAINWRENHEHHDSWTETYDNPEIYHWLLYHKRGRASTVQLEEDTAFLHSQIEILGIAEKIRVQFVVQADIQGPNESLVVVGSVPQLGGGNPNSAPHMFWNKGNLWAREVIMNRSQNFFEYQYAIAGAFGNIVKMRETIKRPAALKTAPSSFMLQDTWGVMRPEQPKTESG